VSTKVNLCQYQILTKAGLSDLLKAKVHLLMILKGEDLERTVREELFLVYLLRKLIVYH